MSSNNSSYQEKYVAFLDIIGFSELVRRLAGDGIERKEEFKSLTKALSRVAGKMAYLNNPDIQKLNRRSKHVQGIAASDNILLVGSNEIDGLRTLIWHARDLQTEMARLGIFLRGAITKGLVYHADSIVFGPAVLDAIELEKIAYYPRVLLSEKVRSDVANIPESDLNGFWPIMRSDDGFAYLPPFSPFVDWPEEDMPTSNEIPDLARKQAVRMTTYLNRMLEGDLSEKDRAKLVWLKNEVAKCLSLWEKINILEEFDTPNGAFI